MGIVASFSAESMPRAVRLLQMRPAGDEMLVHDPSSGSVHVLNATAAHVLKACDGATSLRRIAADVAASTGVGEARVERDILAACSAFREKGLID